MRSYLPLLLLLLISACTNPEKETSQTKGKETIASFVEVSAQIAAKNYQDAYQEAKLLEQTLSTFFSAPTADSYNSVKAQWRKAHDVYSQTEVFRFQNGPIDRENGPEPLINAWPMDESYIESIDSSLQLGIINDSTLEISETLLKSLNEKGGEKNISLGFHAIEFLLWGPDFKDPSNLKPGAREYSDFVDHPLYERRKKYLQVTTALLVQNLKEVAEEWQKEGAYRKEFLRLPKQKALKKLLTGMYMMSKDELAGERIYTALSNADQEDEQSCFSDHTTKDIQMNALGILNLVKGHYKSTDGTEINGVGFKDLIEEDYDFNLTYQKVLAIPEPFDYALVVEEENGPIMQAVMALQEQGTFIENYLHEVQKKP